jgi:hypothetical protein
VKGVGAAGVCVVRRRVVRRRRRWLNCSIYAPGSALARTALVCHREFIRIASLQLSLPATRTQAAPRGVGLLMMAEISATTAPSRH